MKTTGQSIPPEMADAYNKIVSTNAAAPGGVSTLRTSKKVKLTKRPKRPNRKLDKAYQAVDKLIEYLNNKGGWVMPTGFRTDEARRIYAGQFDPQYWVEATLVESKTLVSAASNSAFIGPRNYSYPDPLNEPVHTEYGTGTETTGNPRNSGSTPISTWGDIELAWIRATYKLKNSLKAKDGEPLFLSISATINATANQRPSKPMLSYIYTIAVTEEGDPENTTNEPPTLESKTNYWRYITPRGEPPFFNMSITRKNQEWARYPRSEVEGKTYTHCAIRLAPMPMLGRRYNNNTNVSTSLSGVEVKLYQIRKQEFATWKDTPVWGELTISEDKLSLATNSLYQGGYIESTQYVSSQKWYYEITINEMPTSTDFPGNPDITIIISREAGQNNGYTDMFQWELREQTKKYFNSVIFNWESYGSVINNGDVIGIAIDLDNGTITGYVNGVSQGVMFSQMYDRFTNSFTPIAGDYVNNIALEHRVGEDNASITANFGQSPFTYPVPAGYNPGIYT